MSRKRGLKDILALKAFAATKGWETADDGADTDGVVGAVLVTFPGPEGTPYEGGKFTVCVQLPERYPFCSPSMAFRTKIWHPNIEKASGSICVNVLRDDWTPVLTLVDIFETYLPNLLACPNCKDPFNAEAASQMTANEAEYTEYVRWYTGEFAGPTATD